MNERMTAQLRIIKAVVNALDAAGISAWLFGGWGLDARIGRITREHGDVEFWVERTDAGRSKAVLTEAGATALATQPPEESCEFTWDGTGFSTAYFDRQPDGSSIQLLGRWSDWLFPPGSFGDEPGTLDGMPVLAMSVAGMLAMKEQYPRLRNGRPWRQKDIGDMVVLRRLAGTDVRPCHPGEVPLSIAADAASAAVAAAASLGVACAEPVVLADGANVIAHLRPSPVVAKVAASTPAVRAEAGAWLQRELDLALFLIRAGAPVMAPSREVPATVHHRDGHVMSFWTYLRPSGTGLPDEATIGSMLRDLHAVLRAYPGSLPVLAPLGDIPAFLARPRTLLSAADVCLLTETYTRLTGDLAPAAAPGQVLHGDAGAGNLMAAEGQWVWHDFEDTCSGPAAWDLAATTASPRLDRSRILAAYGDPVDPVQLRTCEQLRRLHLTIWYALYAERLPECRQRAAELLATWRTPSP